MGGGSSNDNMANLWNQGSSYQPPPDYTSLYASLGQGIGRAGQQYAAGVPASLPRAAGSDQISQPFSIPVSGQPQSYPLIPTNKQANGPQPGDIMMILQLLLSGGGN